MHSIRSQRLTAVIHNQKGASPVNLDLSITIKPLLLTAISLTISLASFAKTPQEPLQVHTTIPDDTTILHGLALGFMASKTDSPESDLIILPQELILAKDKSIVGFMGEDFSNHTSRVDRCYIAVFDKARNLLSVVDRRFRSGTSEDSTPCTSARLFATHRMDDGTAWIAFQVSYSSPQVSSDSVERVIEIYHLDSSSDVLCYDETASDEVNEADSSFDKSELIKFLSARKPSPSTQCSK